jgi:hypothetical protein
MTIDAAFGPEWDADVHALGADPSGASFAEVFTRRRGVFRSWLGDEFADFGDDAVALAFASVVAGRLRPWGPAPPTGWDLGSLLDAPSLTCDQFVALALRLFGAVRRGSGGLRIAGVGWRGDSAVGNHAQLAAWDGRRGMALDPTVGVVAAVRTPAALPAFAGPAASVAAADTGDSTTDALRTCVLRVADGATSLRLRDLIYLYPALAPDQVHPVAQDFVARAADGDGRAVCLTGAGELRWTDGTAVPWPAVHCAGIAAGGRADAVLAIDSEGRVWALQDDPHVVAHGAVAVVGGTRGPWLVTGNGVERAGAGSRLRAPATGLVASGLVAQAPVGLDAAGDAWVLRRRARPRRLVRRVESLVAGVGAEQDCAVYLRCGDGDVLRARPERFGRVALERMWGASDNGVGARILRTRSRRALAHPAARGRHSRPGTPPRDRERRGHVGGRVGRRPVHRTRRRRRWPVPRRPTRRRVGPVVVRVADVLSPRRGYPRPHVRHRRDGRGRATRRRDAAPHGGGHGPSRA